MPSTTTKQMSNRYLDESGRLKTETPEMNYMSTEIRSAREAMTIFKILGIKEITTERQRKNGTQAFELPIHKMYGPSNKYPLRFATYRIGYVRDITECNASPYQINKTKQVTYDSGMTGKDRILIPKWEDRLIYLAKFIIKNYYQKPTYLISDYTMDTIKSRYRQANVNRQFTKSMNEVPWNTISQKDDVKIIINGHRYNIC